ncbi:MAG TPA: sugar-binding domain-containing protein, partial [Aestuariivirga sp.]
EGRLVQHPLNNRVMSVDLDTLHTAGHIVLATGGKFRAAAIHAAIKRIGCHTLITDELAARALLRLVRR